MGKYGRVPGKPSNRATVLSVLRGAFPFHSPMGFDVLSNAHVVLA